MFDKCYKIKSIDLSGFAKKRTSSDNFIGMFKECDSLMFIDLSNFYLKEQIEYLFMTYDGTNFNHGNYFNVQYMNLNNSSVEKNGIYSLMNFALEVNQSSTVYFCLKIYHYIMTLVKNKWKLKTI